MSAEKRVPPRSFSILQRNSYVCAPARRLGGSTRNLSAADATQEALCQRRNSIWPHESEDSRVVDSLFPNRAIIFCHLFAPHTTHGNTSICSVLPQQDRIARLFKPTFLRLEGCPQSCPPFGSMCCNQTMSVSEMITAIFSAEMRRSGATCAIRRLVES
jgi:hypothetical protein